MHHNLSILLIVLLCVQMIITDDIMEGCDYDNIQRMYYCNEITHTFPNQFYGDYHLRCVGCNISKFTENTFPYTNSLESFNVSYSGIRGIQRRAFSKFTSTQFIYLDHNDIRDISENAFAGAKQLYELHLEHNHLKRLKPRFLNELGSNSIDLSHNQLVEIGSGVFEGVIGVLHIDLSSNKISELTENAFVGLESLEILSLKDNKICHIPLGVLGRLPALKTLNLSHNKLVEFSIGTFSGLRSLNELNIANNSLQYFDGEFLLTLPNIHWLDVSDNGIFYFDGYEIVENAPSLRQMKMDHNIISCSSLKNLVKYLRRGNIEIVSDSGSYDVPNILGIACSQNEITNVSYKKFYALVQDEAKNLKQIC
ncbi:insulin-like growth factor-binding protein complex acid labile subunit isoform X2 [Coccinella septempunctata]|nr:insulin-like growth factor-binding protein complex acid labile subunit isoform X2 [Coccinella septempunctata]